MSNAIFPTLPGLTWNITRQPEFSTKIQKAVSGRETRIASWNAPMYLFGLTYEFIRDQAGTQSPASPYDELRTLVGFFNSRMGSFQSFLYLDPTDNSITGQAFGVGDGVTTKFQLARSYGGFVEPVQNLNGTPTIYKNGASTTGFTVDSQGLVTFATAPASGVALTWDGSYYYRVRFNADVSQFNLFMKDLWELKKCELYGSLSNKV
jgi:uncharacterized protein (TIGR02217 family)